MREITVSVSKRPSEHYSTEQSNITEYLFCYGFTKVRQHYRSLIDEFKLYVTYIIAIKSILNA